jgi:hypothetical protein
MLTIMGAMTAGSGLFLFLWYRTVVSLPLQRQPLFIRPVAFKWGIPLLSLLLFAAGMVLLASVSPWAALSAAAGAGLLAFLLLKFDRYSAEVRAIHHHYSRVRQANAGLEEPDALYLTAQWRYPDWEHDRLVELVAGKDIQGLILLILIQENNINPIGDWELYRKLKQAVADKAGAKEA